MLSHRICKLILVLPCYSFLLYGCGNTYSTPSSGTMQPPVAARQEPEVQPLPTGQSRQTEEVPIRDTASREAIAVPQKPSEIREAKPDEADTEFIKNRLAVYENKFEHWLELSELTQDKELAEEITSLEMECMQQLERILSGYSLLLEKAQRGNALPAGRIATVSPTKIQQLDIAFLESRCGELLAMDMSAQFEAKPETGPELSFAAAQENITSHMTRGNYQEVLNAYEGLNRDFPDLLPSLSTRINYAVALQYTGRLEAAAQQFQNLLRSDDLAIEPLSLQRETADLLLATGDVAAAESYYDSIVFEHESLGAEKTWAEEQLAFLRTVNTESEEMTAYMNLLREFQMHDYRIDAPRLNEAINVFTREHANSPVAVSAIRLKNFAVEQLRSWFGSQLLKIDALVAEKEYDAAVDILKNMTRYYLPAELQAVLQKTYYDVAQAQSQQMELQRRIQEMQASAQWDAAVKLLDSQRYDSAIAAFEALRGTEYEDQAETKISEAANLAAGRMRKEAASLFIRAGKTTEIEQKKELLVASHELLTDILEKYPQTDLSDKVKQNIAILEVQIQRFDPALLEQIQQKNNDEKGAEKSSTPVTRQLP